MKYKFKIGEIAKVRKCLVTNNRSPIKYYKMMQGKKRIGKGVGFNVFMNKLANHFVMITSIFLLKNHDNTKYYRIEEDNGEWVWSDEMLVKANNQKKAKDQYLMQKMAEKL
jgi:hypothetical protein